MISKWSPKRVKIPGKDTLVYAANDAPRVAHEIVHAKPDVVQAEERGLATEHGFARLHRDPCVRAGEQQCNRLEEL